MKTNYEDVPKIWAESFQRILSYLILVISYSPTVAGVHRRAQHVQPLYLLAVGRSPAARRKPSWNRCLPATLFNRDVLTGYHFPSYSYKLETKYNLDYFIWYIDWYSIIILIIICLSHFATFGSCSMVIAMPGDSGMHISSEVLHLTQTCCSGLVFVCWFGISFLLCCFVFCFCCLFC